MKNLNHHLLQGLCLVMFHTIIPFSQPPKVTVSRLYFTTLYRYLVSIWLLSLLLRVMESLYIFIDPVASFSTWIQQLFERFIYRHACKYHVQKTWKMDSQLSPSLEICPRHLYHRDIENKKVILNSKTMQSYIQLMQIVSDTRVVALDRDHCLMQQEALCRVTQECL